MHKQVQNILSVVTSFTLCTQKLAFEVLTISLDYKQNIQP